MTLGRAAAGSALLLFALLACSPRPVEESPAPSSLAPQASTETPPGEAKVPPDQTPPPTILALIQFGPVEVKDLEIATTSIREHYGFQVEVEPARSLPASAYYAPRKRYRAERLLDWLVDNRPSNARYVMGLTGEDISTTKGQVEDWGICGLGEIDGTASVVSTFRIKKKLTGGTAQERAAQYDQRLADLVAHELGHVLGLNHCPNVGCLMEDARGTVTTFDRSSGQLCADCRHKLGGP